ncbi:MAG: hypothetical protein A4S17_04095 [Proteobacteria bacterium HN_bin10]|nr:MAG: hypothetical protein A4S17_04095 [Proteobacteria bacterium HN_bin10]
MMRAGLLVEGGSFELIDGEVIDMPSEGGDHLELKVRLNKFFIKALPDEVALAPDGTLRLGETHWPQPDLYLYPAAMRADAVRGPDVLLLIELSDTTFRYDIGRKAALYAQHAVREYWVIDLNKKETFVHVLGAEWPRAPVGFDVPLTPTLLSGLTVRLADFVVD